MVAKVVEEVVHDVNSDKLNTELVSKGFQITAMVYQYMEEPNVLYRLNVGDDNDDGEEVLIPHIISVTEVNALEALDNDTIYTIITNNETGIVYGSELARSEEMMAQDLLKSRGLVKTDAKTYKNIYYNVLFYITKGKGNQGKMATSKVNGNTKTDILKGNALQAAKRTAVDKMLKALQKPLAGLLKSQGKNQYATMLNTPEGKALMAGVLGCLQLMLPQLQNENAEVIGDELRTMALSYVTSQVGDLLDPLINAFGEAAESLPKVI